MATADVARFVADVKASKELQAALANKVAVPELVAVAREHGYLITEADVRDYGTRQKAALESAPAPADAEAALTDGELGSVAGGGGFAITDAMNTSLKDATMKQAPYSPPLNIVVGIVIF
ncbi:MAG TPA: Nif11-like leader peptide family natural product precursor [Vicinamibacterales bacterium]|nr:Nif11-like leader peptide family natural product precursor [Vicinamibacterales bacterium]